MVRKIGNICNCRSFGIWIIVGVLLVVAKVTCADLIDDADAFANVGQFERAIELYLTAADNSKSKSDAAYSNAGVANCYISMNQHELAANSFKIAGDIQCKPEYYYNSGMAFLQAATQLSRDFTTEALSSFESCMKCKGNIYPCYLKAAFIYQSKDDFQKVQDYLLKAIAINPNHHDAYIYLADVYNNRKFFKQAIDLYNKVLILLLPSLNKQSASKLGPILINIYNSLGDTYSNSKLVWNAHLSYNAAVELAVKWKLTKDKGVYLESMVGSYVSAQEMAYWHKYEAIQHQLITYTADYLNKLTFSSAPESSGSGNPNIPLTPYRMLILDSSTDVLSTLFSNISRIASSAISKSSVTTSTGVLNTLEENFVIGTSTYDTVPCKGEYERKRAGIAKVRIGYISRRFNDYPGTQMMLRVFGSHNRSRVQVVAIATGPDDAEPTNGISSAVKKLGAYRAIINATVDEFIDISELSSDHAVRSLIEMKLDIIIDYGK